MIFRVLLYAVVLVIQQQKFQHKFKE